LTERLAVLCALHAGRTVPTAERLRNRGPNRLASGASNDTARHLAAVSLAAARLPAAPSA
jgi:hypothetical protein